MGLQEFKQ